MKKSKSKTNKNKLRKDIIEKLIKPELQLTIVLFIIILILSIIAGNMIKKEQFIIGASSGLFAAFTFWLIEYFMTRPYHKENYEKNKKIWDKINKDIVEIKKNIKNNSKGKKK